MNLSPAGRAKIEKLMGDPRYWDSYHPEHGEAVENVTRAFREAYPEPSSRVTKNGAVHVRSYTRHQDGKAVEVSDYDRSAPQQADGAASENRPAEADTKVQIRPPDAPDGVDIEADIQEAARHNGDWLWFYEHVRNGGPWDFKQRGRQFADFGNFHYGAVGAAAGFSENVLLRMAGWAQVHAGTSDPRWGTAPTMVEGLLGLGGKPPFGDDPRDQQWISRGVRYFQSHKRGSK